MGECESTMFDADLSNPQTRWLPGLFEAEPDTLRRQLDEAPERGWIETGPPNLRQFPAGREIPWLADFSARRVRVYDDDRMELVTNNQA